MLGRDGRSNLVSNITKQYNKRVIHLPQGTQQEVSIDVRGQTVSSEKMDALKNRIRTKTNYGMRVKIIEK